MLKTTITSFLLKRTLIFAENFRFSLLTKPEKSIKLQIFVLSFIIYEDSTHSVSSCLKHILPLLKERFSSLSTETKKTISNFASLIVNKLPKTDWKIFSDDLKELNCAAEFESILKKSPFSEILQHFGKKEENEGKENNS